MTSQVQQLHDRNAALRSAGRLVLKIGSSLLIDRESGRLNRAWLESIADELARLQAGDQRERHGGHRRDPLRRQRPPGARVAQMVSADCLVLLSDVDGLYTADPNKDPGAEYHSRGARDHAAHRGHGRRLGVRGGFWRHGHQDRRGAHRHGRRLPHVHRHGAPAAPAAAHRSWARAAPGSCRASRRGGPQAVDRRHAEAARRMVIDAGAVRPCAGPQPAAGGRRGRRGFEAGRRRGVFAARGRVLARGLAAYSSADALRIMGRRSE
jgi:glutamate 5-kinase